jgi:GWxTD domain-containing protein
MKKTALFLCLLLSVTLCLAQSLPELFGNLKDQIKAGSWADALKTLDALDSESSKPGNEAARKQLEGPIAFYLGVCDSNLGNTDKAVEEFGAYLKLQPNAEIDKTMYSKKAIAAFERAQKAATDRSPSLAEAYKEFQPPAESRQRDPADPLWGEGPMRWIMTDGEKQMWTTLPDGNARIAFVETFWGARDPAFKKEFEKRVAFADANLAQDEEQLGSLSDRGMVFILLGPPTYAGRKPLRTGEDANDNAGMSTVGSQDAGIAEKNMKSSRSTTSGKLATQSIKFGSPNRNALDSSNNTMEIWHYRRELLPKAVPYQQVDFEFVTKKGYGINTLQRNTESVNTLEAAKSAAKQPNAPTGGAAGS